ncbi:unnamed protein product [Amoebophrya sp. A120]|nr:unnamed protein product [Amoebophrya sp. A120]|eukprot:GSA120T00015145001.1
MAPPNHYTINHGPADLSRLPTYFLTFRGSENPVPSGIPGIRALASVRGGGIGGMVNRGPVRAAVNSTFNAQLPPPAVVQDVAQAIRDSGFFLGAPGVLAGEGAASVDTDQDLWAMVKSKVVVELLPHQGHPNYSEDDRARYAALADTAFGLVPRGDGRWNYRFSELVGACVIPVVIADGLTLPFSELVDWAGERLVIRIPEDVVLRTSTDDGETSPPEPDPLLGIFEHLKPFSKDDILKRRRRLCEINDLYFATSEKRAQALLMDAKAYLEKEEERRESP